TSARRFIMSSVIDGSFESGWCQQPDLTGELSMTTAKPLARYSAIEGALASGFATAELHHLFGTRPVFFRFLANSFLHVHRRLRIQRSPHNRFIETALGADFSQSSA
ncbi:hypothetical protein NKJ10_30645, partial [Mesorhizobium sp. M0204]